MTNYYTITTTLNREIISTSPTNMCTVQLIIIDFEAETFIYASLHYIKSNLNVIRIVSNNEQDYNLTSS